MTDLLQLRQALDEIDTTLIDAIAKRQAIVAQIAQVKQASGKQLRDFKREAEVLANVRKRAEAVGLNPNLGEGVMKLLIESSLTNQELRRVQSSEEGATKTALVLGGNGKMGRWFAQFLQAQSFDVVIADPSGTPDGFRSCADWHAVATKVDVIVIAATMRASVELLSTLQSLSTHALIFDLGSLKTPLKAGLRGCAAQGLKICSLHPMFGPDTQLLSDRHVICIDLGHPHAVKEAKALFAATSAELVDMDLDEHDELIAYVLGLSHALNICFFTTLANSGNSAPKLAKLSSTTFDRQLSIASRVAEENPRLYFEIQHLNAARENALTGLSDALAELTRCVRSGDEIGFVAMMERGRGYLSARVANAGVVRG